MAQLASPQAVLAAGVLEGLGATHDLSAGAARQLLRDALSPSSLWIRWDLRGQLSEFRPSGIARRPARWVIPSAPGLRSAGLEAAWEEVLGSYRPPHPPLLRLTVPSLAAANRLAEIGEVSGIPIVALIEGPARPLTWHWPLRVAVADGPRAREWLDRLADSSSYARGLFRTRILATADDELTDILLVDLAQGRPVSVDHDASSVIFVGDSTSADDVLRLKVNGGNPAAIAWAPADGVEWFGCLVQELARDQPLDAAITLAVPGARIAGDPDLMPFTAVGHWAAALANQAEWSGIDQATTERLRAMSAGGDFRDEGGARRLAELAIDAEARGEPLELRLPRQLAAAEPSTVEESAPPPAPSVEPPVPPLPESQPRRLFADFVKDDEVIRSALAPETDYTLAVRIAVPRGDSPYGVLFNESAIGDDEGGGIVDLDVDVIGPGYHEVQSIRLPVADRTKDSDVAEFAYRTGEPGKIHLRITVLHKKRPIQEAEIIGAVRARPLPTSRIQLAPRMLSSNPEPDPDRTTAADVFLDWTGRTLRRRGEADYVEVAFANIHEILDRIEQGASAALTAEGASAEETARANLVTLALLGKQLRQALDELNIGDAHTIAMQVDYNSPLLPLELAYDGPAPGDTARLCKHLKTPPEDTTTPCKMASERIVCPYAFWGTYRTIARTVEARKSAAAAPPALRPLSLRPILWGVTARADAGAAAPKPSELLAQALATSVGAEQVFPAKNWREWSRQVKRHQPQLLLVLGHTDVAPGGAVLEIGHGGRLLDARITTSMLRGEQAPAPLVLLIACATAVAGGLFGALPATLTANGAAAVVATLSKLRGPDGATAAIRIVSALLDSAAQAGGSQLGAALADARRQLLAQGNLAGLFLVSHGEIDIQLTA